MVVQVMVVQGIVLAVMALAVTVREVMVREVMVRLATCWSLRHPPLVGRTDGTRWPHSFIGAAGDGLESVGAADRHSSPHHSSQCSTVSSGRRSASLNSVPTV